MANSITGNPWYLDTVGVIVRTRFKLDGGVWTPAAAADVLTIVDNTGRVIISLIADTVKANVDIPRVGWVNGVTVTAMAGHIVIYVGNK